MSKIIKIILIFVLSIVAICVTGVMILFMTGKLKFKNFHIDFNNKVSERLAYSETIDSSFSEIKVDADMADIEIKEALDGIVKLDIFPNAYIMSKRLCLFE